MKPASRLAASAWTRWTVHAACCLLAVVLLTASPRTCAEDRGSYQGLWWAAPAGSESGWGLNVAHQGDILVTRTPVGTLRLAFSDGNHAAFEATVGETSLVKAITRQVESGKASSGSPRGALRPPS